MANKRSRLLGAIAILIVSISCADSAQITLLKQTKDRFGDNVVDLALSGDITLGDRARLEAVLKPLQGHIVLHLESRGGIFVEGIAIARLLSSKQIATEVDANK